MFEQSIIDSSDGTVSTLDIILNMNAAIRRILEGRLWSAAFDGNGWSLHQGFVRDKIVQTLECSNLPEISSALPSL